ILALDTPAALKRSVGAEQIVTVKASGDGAVLAERLQGEIEEIDRTRVVEGGVELHVRGAERLVSRIVTAAESGGFEVADLSGVEPSLETLFIGVNGKGLRDRWPP